MAGYAELIKIINGKRAKKFEVARPRAILFQYIGFSTAFGLSALISLIMR